MQRNVVREQPEQFWVKVQVMGGFRQMDGEEAEKHVNDALAGVDGFQEAYTTHPSPTVVFAQFSNH